jgi:1-acyl-sn-glycerol-3-phosphate acyltransferase
MSGPADRPTGVPGRAGSPAPSSATGSVAGPGTDSVTDSVTGSTAVVAVGRPGPTDPDGLRRSDVDEWGRSERVRAVARTLYGPVYSRWFRVEWTGLEKIPRTGGALLVANHAGGIPSDAPVIMHGIEQELGRPVYGMADYFFRTLPVLGTLWSRAGGVPASPENAYRLLRQQGQLALVFPEGTKGPSKSFTHRYQLRRFGRGGFVEIAMRAGVPIVPIAVIGSEEAMPVLTRIPALSRLLGLPYFPVTANMVLLGPAGAVIPFPAKFRLAVLDPITFDVPPDQERYPRSRIMDESKRIRALLQERVLDMLADRRSVWFG